MKSGLKDFIRHLKKLISESYITSRFLLLIGGIAFIMIGISVFKSDLDANGNLATIRTAFSSIIGFVLEKTSRKMICTETSIMLKNYCVGILCISMILIIGLSVIFEINMNNPSLILFKNLLFSGIGFLISSTKECEYE
ncbi:hypothetical protein [uncultured Clostridium sp.]|uniref:hypothetical protein n=1 Tax=uncultured Clostridium sp. TaxID=59620 RepID=UPI002621D4CC|nr:hypothetical protein [uncultured Clostridium sp.]